MVDFGAIGGARCGASLGWGEYVYDVAYRPACVIGRQTCRLGEFGVMYSGLVRVRFGFGHLAGFSSFRLIFCGRVNFCCANKNTKPNEDWGQTLNGLVNLFRHIS